ncbi:MAG TPA: DUF5597 domain-containing protein, partial [Terricaulis sp.]|nr:DUF5597 domain-containing protein [Terricaulis sp.]
SDGLSGEILRIEQGHFDADGAWVFERRWNGDQTDYGLNLTDRPVLLRVRLAAHAVASPTLTVGDTHGE